MGARPGFVRSRPGRIALAQKAIMPPTVVQPWHAFIFLCQRRAGPAPAFSGRGHSLGRLRFTWQHRAHYGANCRRPRLSCPAVWRPRLYRTVWQGQGWVGPPLRAAAFCWPENLSRGPGGFLLPQANPQRRLGLFDRARMCAAWLLPAGGPRQGMGVLACFPVGPRWLRVCPTRHLAATLAVLSHIGLIMGGRAPGAGKPWQPGGGGGLRAFRPPVALAKAPGAGPVLTPPHAFAGRTRWGLAIVTRGHMCVTVIWLGFAGHGLCVLCDVLRHKVMPPFKLCARHRCGFTNYLPCIMRFALPHWFCQHCTPVPFCGCPGTFPPHGFPARDTRPCSAAPCPKHKGKARLCMQTGGFCNPAGVRAV